MKVTATTIITSVIIGVASWYVINRIVKAKEKQVVEVEPGVVKILPAEHEVYYIDYKSIEEWEAAND